MRARSFSVILRSKGLALTFLTAISAVAAFGQASAVRSGSFEVGPFIGASYGLDKFRVMGGGNVTYALKNKYVLPYFEYSYFPGLPRTVSGSFSGVAYTHDFSLNLSDVHGGVHVRLPVFREKPIVPYLVFGLGTLISTDRTDQVSLPSVNAKIPVTVPGGANFAVNGGGGIRYYIGGSGAFGIRAEAKVYKPATGPFSDTTFGKVEFGFFFQLH